MQIPVEFASNVYCLKNVAFINWEVFDSKLLDNIQDDDKISKEQSRLEAASQRLLQHGYVVFHNPSARFIWTFQLPTELESTDREKRTRKLRCILRDHKLDRLSSGTIFANELGRFLRHETRSASGSSKVTTSNLPSPMSDAFRADEATDHTPTSFPTNFTRHNVYDALVSALLCTLSFRLCLKCSMIPLCYNILVYDPNEVDDGIFYDLWSSNLQSIGSGWKRTSTPRRWKSLTIAVNWLVDGNLVFMYRKCPAEYVTYTSSSDESTRGGEVIIAPLGLRLPAYQMHTRPNSPNRKQQRQQHATLSALQLRGISVSESPNWIRCSLQDSSPDDRPSASARSFMWPGELAFVCSTSAPPEPMPHWIDPSHVEDPLQLAHLLHGFSTSALSHNERDPPQSQASDLGQVDQYALILDGILGFPGGAGIYPTPPELTRSQPALHRDRMEFSAPTPATTISAHTLRLDGNDTPTDDAQGQILIESNETNHDDDLFSDFGVDFSREELNEDEFEFFDVSKTGDAADSPLHQTEVAGLELNTQVYEKDSRSRDKTVSFNFEQQQEEDGLDLDHDLPMPPESHSADYDLANASTTSNDSRANFPGDVNITRPDQSIPSPLDDKYQSGGMFNALKPTGPSTHTPRAGIAFTRAIPIITVTDRDRRSQSKSHAVSDTESTSDTSDSGMDIEDTSDEEVEDTTESQSDASATEDLQLPKLNDVPVFELFAIRAPLLTVGAAHSKNLFRAVSQHLNLNEVQFMELSRLVASQISKLETECSPGNPSYSRGPQGSRPFDYPLRDATSTTVRNTTVTSSEHIQYSKSFTGYQSETKIDSTFDTVMRGTSDTIINQTLQECAALESDLVPQQSSGQLKHEMSDFDSVHDEQTVSLLNVPQIVVKRDDTRATLSAAAASFWNELGISPLGGQVKIVGYCFTPKNETWIRGAAGLLRALHEDFLTLRLGSHIQGTDTEICEEDNPGIVTVDPGSSFQTFFHNMCQSLSTFGQAISRLGGTPQTVAIYMVNTADDLSAVPSFCAAFQKLQGLLGEKCSTKHNLILKIVPRSCIIYDLSFETASRSFTESVSREMYCRCLRIEEGQTASRPLTHLARSIPRSITFNLSRDHIYNPLGPNVVTHVAYSWTPGNPWLSFAYCNDVGERQWHASYHVPWERTQQQSSQQHQAHTTIHPSPIERGSTNSSHTRMPSQSLQANMWQRFVHVARDVLATLVDDCKEGAASGHGRVHNVVLVKDGPMLPREEVVWRSLTERCAKPGGVASILSMGNAGGDAGGNEHYTDIPPGIEYDRFHPARTMSKRHIHNTTMNFTIAILDPECPIQLRAPPAWWTDSSMDPPGLYQSTPFTQDLPASVPGTPSLASPGFPNTGGAGFSGMGPSHGDTEFRNGRLIRVTNLAWFVSAKCILAQSYTGKLEAIPTPLLTGSHAAGQDAESRPHQQPQQHRAIQRPVSGGGYLIVNGCDMGDDLDAGHSRTRTPSVFSLRIVEARAPSPYPTVKDLAQAYRGLMTISDVCGMVGTRLPWHIATARRSRMGLGKCM